ncbi:hypothetical protein AB1Y20_000601 [Prymnesium parvum]|uniref:DNA 3'-5' helicase n=1 Tax=Prymnesium parvum TaxID=97485 RepID=A0AB34KAJ3_PRYPA
MLGSAAASASDPPELPSVASMKLALALHAPPKVHGAATFTEMKLCANHQSRPFWLLPDGRVILDSSSTFYKEACEFLVAISEPVCRTRFLQEYQLTHFSLYAGASMGLKTEEILGQLRKFSKLSVPIEVVTMVEECTARYGKVKLVLQKDRLYVECQDPEILEQLIRDPVLSSFRVIRQPEIETDETHALAEEANADSATAMDENYLEAARLATNEDEEGTGRMINFEVDVSKVKEVKERCSRDINWPLLEEYDFRSDTSNAEVPIELKSDTQIREYQSKALSRMFSNHRARSGIIVLPCGAGKTLVGIVAATTVKRSCLVLCNSSVSVEQWYAQFRMWTSIDEQHITKFTANNKEMPHPDACVLISTYNMISFSGHRSVEAEAIMQDIRGREWGLLLMDEVHVVPAATFLTCTTRTRSRCKLGLTATLVREDGKIEDLNFLIGPKLYEANWLELQANGYIATVSCAEVWCEMTPEFYREYLKASKAHQRLLYAMNPNKFRSCEYLIRFHEARGDKVIVFSDNVFALKKYAVKMGRPMIFGATSQNERMLWLQEFKAGGRYNTIFISKVGDTSIDIPEANVIIQIASHFGARRQEAQRLGRILRPKANAVEGFNAFFYTLISRDTQEMYYSTKRQQFLVDQGYAFKVITKLADMESSSDLSYSSREEQMELLSQVMSENAADIAAHELAEDDATQDLERRSGSGGMTAGKSVASRNKRSMSDLSGGSGLAYNEMSKKPKPAIFRERERMLKAANKARNSASIADNFL